jgi:hypothetical protein
VQKNPVEILATQIDSPVSKWLHLQVLLSLEEIKTLFDALKPLYLFFNGKVLSQEEVKDQQETFYQCYEKYLENLFIKEGDPLPPFCLTRTEKSVYAFQAGQGKFLIKPRAPLIQVREHRFLVTHDGRFSSMGFGKGSIPWGLQFSFPQLVLVQGNIVEVMKSSAYENVVLFRSLQLWIREYTRPSALIINGKKTNCTFRVGLAIKERMEDSFDRSFGHRG